VSETTAHDQPDPRDEVVPRPKKEPKQPRPAAGSNDPNAIKTLVVTGLPKDLTKNVLWKKVRKINTSIELVFPVEDQEDTGE
jgi:nucleolar protein 4